jgi:hypothetical protein
LDRSDASSLIAGRSQKQKSRYFNRASARLLASAGAESRSQVPLFWRLPVSRTKKLQTVERLGRCFDFARSIVGNIRTDHVKPVGVSVDIPALNVKATPIRSFGIDAPKFLRAAGGVEVDQSQDHVVLDLRSGWHRGELKNDAQRPRGSPRHGAPARCHCV